MATDRDRSDQQLASADITARDDARGGEQDDMETSPWRRRPIGAKDRFAPTCPLLIARARATTSSLGSSEPMLTARHPYASL